MPIDNAVDENAANLFVCLIDFISAFKNIQIQSQSTKFRTITNTMNTMFTKVIK